MKKQNNIDLETAFEIVDLLSFGTTAREWGMGKSRVCEYTVASIVQAVKSTLAESGNGFLLFLLDDQSPQEESIHEALRSNPSIEVWYDDLPGGPLQWPVLLDVVAPVNYFNMPVPEAVPTMGSITLRCLLVRKSILVDHGFLEEQFVSVEGAVKEWAHRLIYQGILFQYASLLPATIPKETLFIPLEDQYRFIKYRFGKKWFLWSLWRSRALGIATNNQVLSGYRNVRKDRPRHPAVTRDHRHWKATATQTGLVKVTVLVPTVERYPYVVTVLKQLAEQTILPFEVIVVDQTPQGDRKPELFEGHDRIGLSYFTMDEAGQCASRNFGLLRSQGDYILFIDDDVEIGADLIQNHLKSLDYFNAHVSCGVCDEVGAGPNPKEYELIRHSDVFPTNNVMVKREVLERSGLFDLAYNRGQRADGDLGARIYKTGARMILNPGIRLLHYRAPRGGLRKHKVRMVTYASSRQYIRHFRLPHITELYFAKIHCTPRQQREYNILTLLGTFSIKGGLFRKALKAMWALVMLPSFWYKMTTREKAAKRMLKDFPRIPMLERTR